MVEMHDCITSRVLYFSNPMLKIKADKLANELNHHDFNATVSWLFRCRMKNQFMIVHGVEVLMSEADAVYRKPKRPR